MLAALLLAGATARSATVEIPTDATAIDAAFAKYDPQAVAAAKHYAAGPEVEAGMLSMIHSMEPLIIRQREQRSGKPMSEAAKANLKAALTDAFADTLPLLLKLNALVLLQVLTKDELVALDTFYSSPMGMRIKEKMPQVSAATGEIMRVFSPRFAAALAAHMQTLGSN